jgi:hypothetical protein
MGYFDHWDRSRKRPLHQPEGLKAALALSRPLLRSTHDQGRLVGEKPDRWPRSLYVYRRLAILAEIRRRANNLRFDKLEHRLRLARRPVP